MSQIESHWNFKFHFGAVDKHSDAGDMARRCRTRFHRSQGKQAKFPSGLGRRIGHHRTVMADLLHSLWLLVSHRSGGPSAFTLAAGLRFVQVAPSASGRKSRLAPSTEHRLAGTAKPRRIEVIIGEKPGPLKSGVRRNFAVAHAV